MRKLCDDIDHQVLLPTENPHLQIAEQGRFGDGRVRQASRATSSRKRDCALLPVPNTTVEMLAELLTDRLQAELRDGGRQGSDRDRDGSRGELRPVGDVSSHAGRSAPLSRAVATRAPSHPTAANTSRSDALLTPPPANNATPGAALRTPAIESTSTPTSRPTRPTSSTMMLPTPAAAPCSAISATDRVE